MALSKILAFSMFESRRRRAFSVGRRTETQPDRSMVTESINRIPLGGLHIMPDERSISSDLQHLALPFDIRAITSMVCPIQKPGHYLASTGLPCNGNMAMGQER